MCIRDSTYALHQGMPVEEFGYVKDSGVIDLEELERKIDDQTAAVIVQSPNFFEMCIRDRPHITGVRMPQMPTPLASRTVTASRKSISSEPPKPNAANQNSGVFRVSTTLEI